MRHKIFTGLILLCIAAGLSGWTGGYTAGPPREVIYQVSTLGALLEGIYDGEITFGQLKAHGDTGIGTFNGLDGEMICLDGKVYQIKADGAVYPVSDTTQTPFAVVTYFDNDQALALQNIQNFGVLTNLITTQLLTRNIFYAIRVDGDFDYVKVRSVPKQAKPYPVMTEVTKNQPVFEYQNVKGTLIGLYCPPYSNGINLPGYHFHFISADRKVGGHLLECRIAQGTALIDATHEFRMILPGNPEFYNVDLSGNKEEQIKKVER